MKASPLKFSFGVSLLIHGALIGSVALFSQFHRTPVATLVNDVATLELIAAPQSLPERVVTAPSAPVTLPPPPTETVVPEKPANLPPEEKNLFPQPVAPAAVAEVAVATPEIVAPPPATIRGDGSSQIPGRDVTTAEGKRTAKAKPDYLKNPEPTYPAAARRRRQEGLVLLTARVSATGHATSITLKQSSGYQLLDEAALNAVREWEFEPARIGSLAVESEIEVPVRFKLMN